MSNLFVGLGETEIDATLLQNARERFQCFKWSPQALYFPTKLVTDTSSSVIILKSSHDVVKFNAKVLAQLQQQNTFQRYLSLIKFLGSVVTSFTAISLLSSAAIIKMAFQGFIQCTFKCSLILSTGCKIQLGESFFNSITTCEMLDNPLL